MPDPQASEASRRFEPQSETYDPDRRSTVRTGTVLNRIEDTTYAILRKHEQNAQSLKSATTESTSMFCATWKFILAA